MLCSVHEYFNIVVVSLLQTAKHGGVVQPHHTPDDKLTPATPPSSKPTSAKHMQVKTPVKHAKQATPKTGGSVQYQVKDKGKLTSQKDKVKPRIKQKGHVAGGLETSGGKHHDQSATVTNKKALKSTIAPKIHSKPNNQAKVAQNLKLSKQVFQKVPKSIQKKAVSNMVPKQVPKTVLGKVSKEVPENVPKQIRKGFSNKASTSKHATTFKTAPTKQPSEAKPTKQATALKTAASKQASEAKPTKQALPKVMPKQAREAIIKVNTKIAFQARTLLQDKIISGELRRLMKHQKIVFKLTDKVHRANSSAVSMELLHGVNVPAINRHI